MIQTGWQLRDTDFADASCTPRPPPDVMFRYQGVQVEPCSVGVGKGTTNRPSSFR